MNKYYTNIKLSLADEIVAEVKAIVRKMGTIPKYYYFNIDTVDELVALHSTILSTRYGVHGTSMAMTGDNNVPHYDFNRQAALNFAIEDCGAGADTLFYVALPGSQMITLSGNSPEEKWGKVVYGPVRQVDSLTLTDSRCVLLNTDELHTVRNYSRPNRIVLSIDCKVSYREAYEYFANLGLIELDILDSDRPGL